MDDPRRRGIKKGKFLVSDPIPPGYTVKRRPLPDDLQHFESAATVADQLAEFDRAHAAQVGELARRLEAVRAQLADIKKRENS
jgi:hypothetical protein